jgi:hypothetical protein
MFTDSVVGARQLIRLRLSMVLKKRGYLAAIAGDRQISTPAAGAVKLRAA